MRRIIITTSAVAFLLFTWVLMAQFHPGENTGGGGVGGTYVFSNSFFTGTMTYSNSSLAENVASNDGAGNSWQLGSNVASAFYGDGSHLTGITGGLAPVPAATITWTGSNVSFSVGTNSGFEKTNTFYFNVTNSIVVTVPSNNYDTESWEMTFIQNTSNNTNTITLASSSSNSWDYPFDVPSQVWTLTTNAGGATRIMCKMRGTNCQVAGPLSYPQ